MTYVSDKTVKNWRRMQNEAEFWVFHQVEEYACMLYMKFDFVRIFHKVRDIKLQLFSF